MVLKDTICTMRQHLVDLLKDLEKASLGNRAAAQRVRTESIKFARTAKIYRKESISAEKGTTKKGKKLTRGSKKAPTKSRK